MSDYPKELMPTADGASAYGTPPEAAAAAYAAVYAKASPVDRIVTAFDALKGHVEALDAEGLAVLASCAEQIVINGFHQKGAEALTVRDAAVAAMD